jgi:4-diphosphocytidyl-2-C-methyl-D-erythritol kinase
MQSIREIAPAKVNLTLSVRGRRPDGYHELESLVTFADLHDIVELEPAPASHVSVSGPFASRIAGANLLDRALTLLREAEPRLTLGLVRLEKHLPVAAGLGGGSADAGALLRAVRGANPELGESVRWRDIAAQLGADVPVCLLRRPALMWGIGEKTIPVRRLQPLHGVLANPGVPLSTADVFRALQAGSAREMPQLVAPDLKNLRDVVQYMRVHGNDLERAATELLPLIAEVKAALAVQPGCLIAAMAGSGPTCFGIFTARADAKRAADTLAHAHAGWWVRPAALEGVMGTRTYEIR